MIRDRFNLHRNFHHVDGHDLAIELQSCFPEQMRVVAQFGSSHRGGKQNGAAQDDAPNPKPGGGASRHSLSSSSSVTGHSEGNGRGGCPSIDSGSTLRASA